VYVGNNPLKYIDPTGLYTDYNKMFGDVDNSTFDSAQYSEEDIVDSITPIRQAVANRRIADLSAQLESAIQDLQNIASPEEYAKWEANVRAIKDELINSISDMMIAGYRPPILENPVDVDNPDYGSPQWAVQLHINQEYKSDFQITMEYAFSVVMRGFVGIDYIYGGQSTSGVDCSGTVLLVLELLGFNIGSDFSAAELGSGRVTWLSYLPDIISVNQGKMGVLNFYDHETAGVIDHVNTGVGQFPGERTTQIVDATFGDWMVNARSEHPLQLRTPRSNSINQTFTPAYMSKEPVLQAVIDFDALRRGNN
jgi:hypothetical protein